MTPAATFCDPLWERAFQEQGFVVLPGYLSETDLAHFRLRFQQWYPDRRGDFETTALNEAGDAHHLEVHHELHDWFQPRLASTFVDQEIRHAYTMCKRAWAGEADRSTVLLHQDWTYVDEPRVRGALMWCPLVDVTEENGWLQVVPGSHVVTDRPRGTGELPWALADVEERLRRHLVPVPVQAGDVIVYDGALVHASPANRTAVDRPVLGLGLAPRGERLLHYFSEDGSTVERYEVEDAFYLEHWLGGRPQRSYVDVRTEVLDRSPITERDLDRVLGPPST